MSILLLWSILILIYYFIYILGLRYSIYYFRQLYLSFVSLFYYLAALVFILVIIYFFLFYLSSTLIRLTKILIIDLSLNLCSGSFNIIVLYYFIYTLLILALSFSSNYSLTCILVALLKVQYLQNYII